MLDHLVEDWILLLFKLPIGDVGGSQPSRSRTNNHLLAGFLIIWIRPHSLFSPFTQGLDDIVQDSLDPWIWDLVQVVLDFAREKVVIQMTQKVGHSVIFTLLVLEGKAITGQLGYPSLSGGIQIGRGEDVGEWVIVRLDNKLIPILPIWRQILVELFSDSSLES